LPFPPRQKVWPHRSKRAQQRERPTSFSFNSLQEKSEPSELEAQSRSSDQQPGPSIAFGPFHLYPRQRLLVEGKKTRRLGSRALDILIVLLERPGELVSKQELIARVWPGIFVDETNLKAHVAALRRTLRDGQIGKRYICTVPGRGYWFVAPVVKSEAPMQNVTADHGLPAASAPLASDRDLVGMLASQLSRERFITVVGVGDIVKGIFLAAALMGHYRHGIRFVDCAAMNTATLVPSVVGAAVGLEVSNSDPMARITAYLEDKQMLLVLHNCRHVVGETASFATSVLRCAPGVQILAISR